jgi:hypothetical protein
MYHFSKNMTFKKFSLEEKQKEKKRKKQQKKFGLRTPPEC